MLFDLQSRRRRTAVKIIYAFLALLMAGGLVLLGVGTGSGQGGLLNAVGGSNNGSGSNSGQTSLATAALKKADAEVKARPSSPAAWQAMMQARYEVASSGSNFNTSTLVYSAAGKAELEQVLSAWNKYSSLVKVPDQSTTLQAARVYAIVDNFSGATIAWQDYIQADPSAKEGYACLAYTAYAAKKTDLGDEAAAKVISLTPKLDKLTTQETFKEIKGSQTDAEEAAQAYCGSGA